MDINFNKSTNITWKPDNTLEVASRMFLPHRMFIPFRTSYLCMFLSLNKFSYTNK